MKTYMVYKLTIITIMTTERHDVYFVRFQLFDRDERDIESIYTGVMTKDEYETLLDWCEKYKKQYPEDPKQPSWHGYNYLYEYELIGKNFTKKQMEKLVRSEWVNTFKNEWIALQIKNLYWGKDYELEYGSLRFNDKNEDNDF